MMPVDQFIKTNRRIPTDEHKSNRYHGHQPNPLFSVDTTEEREEVEEVCPCCIDKKEVYVKNKALSL